MTGDKELGDARASIPHNELGQPDLQALVRQCGGYDKISPAQQRRRAGLAPPKAARAMNRWESAR
jgi:hypothetical protein